MPRMIRDDSGDRNGWWYGDRFYPFDAPEQIARLREELEDKERLHIAQIGDVARRSADDVSTLGTMVLCMQARAEAAERREREALELYNAKMIEYDSLWDEAEKIRIERDASQQREREALAGNLSELQREITEWGKATFPNSTLDSVYAHWKDEIDEFMRAHRGEGGFVGEEMADYLILSLQYASFFGFDLLTEMLKKFETNKGRAWGEPDERGVVSHVREAREQEVPRG